MKKLVIAALAIGTMAACTKSNVQYEQPGEISFQPVTQKATKAAVAGPTYPTDDAAYNFNVWAWWGNDNAIIDGAYSKFSSLYIDKGTFVHKGNNTWGGDPAYYWPTTGSLVFAGYSPATAEGKFTYTPSTKTFKVEDYTQSNLTAETKDLMWFDITDKSYNTRKIDDDIIWVGADNRRLALFEAVYSVTRGISYNSYMIIDEKIALVDTVDRAVTDLFLENIEHTLAGRPLDYLIICPCTSNTMAKLALGICDTPVTMAAKLLKNVERSGYLEISGGRLTGFCEKGATGEGLINGGIYFIDKNVLDCINEEKFSFEKQVLEALLLEVNIFESEAYFIDIGIPEEFARANNEKDLLNENFTARPITPIELHKGWNKVFIKLPNNPDGGIRLNKWMFTFVVTDCEGKNALDNIIYVPNLP